MLFSYAFYSQVLIVQTLISSVCCAFSSDLRYSGALQDLHAHYENNANVKPATTVPESERQIGGNSVREFKTLRSQKITYGRID